MTHPQDDPAAAREQLLTKLRRIYGRKLPWSEEVMARRVARMTDKQVAAALALSDEEVKAKAKAAPDRSPQYAPATDDGPPVRLWDHVEMG